MLSLVGNQVVAAHRMYTLSAPGGLQQVWLHAPTYVTCACSCAQVVTLAPFASCAALIELFLRSNAICDLEEVTHTHTHTHIV